MDCNNCDTHKAVARNNDFCNVCEYEYHRILNLILIPSYRSENGNQAMVDEIMKQYTN